MSSFGGPAGVDVVMLVAMEFQNLATVAMPSVGGASGVVVVKLVAIEFQNLAPLLCHQ